MLGSTPGWGPRRGSGPRAPWRQESASRASALRAPLQGSVRLGDHSAASRGICSLKAPGAQGPQPQLRSDVPSQVTNKWGLTEKVPGAWPGSPQKRSKIPPIREWPLTPPERKFAIRGKGTRLPLGGPASRAVPAAQVHTPGSLGTVTRQARASFPGRQPPPVDRDHPGLAWVPHSPRQTHLTDAANEARGKQTQAPAEPSGHWPPKQTPIWQARVTRRDTSPSSASEVTTAGTLPGTVSPAPILGVSGQSTASENEGRGWPCGPGERGNPGRALPEKHSTDTHAPRGTGLGEDTRQCTSNVS